MLNIALCSTSHLIFRLSKFFFRFFLDFFWSLFFLSGDDFLFRDLLGDFFLVEVLFALFSSTPFVMLGTTMSAGLPKVETSGSSFSSEKKPKIETQHATSLCEKNIL